MTHAPLSLLGSVNGTELLLIVVAVLVLVGARVPVFLVRLARRAGER